MPEILVTWPGLELVLLCGGIVGFVAAFLVVELIRLILGRVR